MESYAKLFGLVPPPALRLAGESAGMVAGPTNSELFGSEWLPGNDLSAAIGQSDHQYTVLQIANMVGHPLQRRRPVRPAPGQKRQEQRFQRKRCWKSSPNWWRASTIEPENLEAVLTGMNDVGQ